MGPQGKRGSPGYTGPAGPPGLAGPPGQSYQVPAYEPAAYEPPASGYQTLPVQQSYEEWSPPVPSYG